MIIDIETIPTNPLCRVYHVDIRIIEFFEHWTHESEKIWEPILDPITNQPCHDNLGEIERVPVKYRASSFVNDLFHISGVDEVSLRKYSITITKARVFSWDAIEPSVIHLIKKHFDIVGHAQSL